MVDNNILENINDDKLTSSLLANTIDAWDLDKTLGKGKSKASERFNLNIMEKEDLISITSEIANAGQHG